jgi:hypothetical protein
MNFAAADDYLPNFRALNDIETEGFMTLGGRPEVIKSSIDVPEIYGAYILYMPILMPSRFDLRLPPGLEPLKGIIQECVTHEEQKKKNHFKYAYLSYECSFVEAGKTQKRPGWHADGFLTNDVNYIWYSAQPTIFNRKPFRVTPDHEKSIEEFEQQADERFNFTATCRSLLRIDQTVVHKAAPAEFPGVRTFVKVSFSDAEYNLKGNTHNPLFNYSWKMFDRSAVRNHPTLKEVDSVPEDFDEGDF